MGNVLSLACFSPIVSFKTTKKHRITRNTASQETIRVNVNESREDIGPLPTPQLRSSDSNQGIQRNSYNPHEFTMNGPKLYGDLPHSDTFMKEFAGKIIPGAAFDSSERDPPPICHPGTRLAIVERTMHFFADRGINERLLWIVGPAGVGKSAIMQTLAETSPTPIFTLGASLFFSVNGRDNGLKTIVTLAYQLAVKSPSYRNFVQRELAKDPTLLDKALAPQFEKFIFEPFVLRGISPEGHERFLILIDGLDECNGQDTQRALLKLISSFCIQHRTAPLVWVIASRPEPHITRFLFPPNSTPCCTKEEIEVDNDESRNDVEQYLRNGLENIRTKYPALDHFPHWPAEYDFLKIAAATGGLFAFGKTVVDYIDDPSYANPVSQLDEVLKIIDEIRSQDSEEGKQHPMAGLDVLYSRIMSKIPQGTLKVTKRLLLCMISPLATSTSNSDLESCCSWLGISRDAAYGALHHLHSVLNIPSAQFALFSRLYPRHKSFRDYLADFERSGMFQNVDDEGYELHLQCATRILNGIFEIRRNELDPWAPSTRNQRDRCDSALDFITHSIRDRRLFSGTGIHPAIRLVDILFIHHSQHWLLDFASAIFDKGVRPELMRLGVLQEMPIGTLSMENIPIVRRDTLVSCLSQPPDLPPKRWLCDVSICQQRAKDLERLSKDQYSWNAQLDCDCILRARQEMESRRTSSPGDIVSTFTDGTGDYGWVHYTFPDSEHSSTTWEFILPYRPQPIVAIVESK